MKKRHTQKNSAAAEQTTVNRNPYNKYPNLQAINPSTGQYLVYKAAPPPPTPAMGKVIADLRIELPENNPALKVVPQKPYMPPNAPKLEWPESIRQMPIATLIPEIRFSPSVSVNTGNSSLIFSPYLPSPNTILSLVANQTKIKPSSGPN